MKTIPKEPQYSVEFLKKYFETQFPYLRVDGTENRETFFARVSEHFYPMSPEFQKILKAYDTAKKAFEKKYRQTGERYFEHLRGVALILMIHLRVSDADLICAALLHDIVEDCPETWSLERLRAEFGDRVAAIVEQVTNPPDDMFESESEKMDFIHRRQKNMSREAAMVKLADRLHNMFTLWSPVPREKIIRKVAETQHHYLGLAEKHTMLYWELHWILELHHLLPNFKGWLKVARATRKRN